MEQTTDIVIEMEELDDELLDEVVGGGSLGQVFAVGCAVLDINH